MVIASDTILDHSHTDCYAPADFEIFCDYVAVPQDNSKLNIVNFVLSEQFCDGVYLIEKQLKTSCQL